jgi:formylglycine-generating enzyme required for sulfatase activity
MASILGLAAAGAAAAPTVRLQPRVDPATIVAERDGMVLVPAGEFTMGSQRGDAWAESDELPQRIVQVAAFYIDQLEVTNLEFRRFLEATAWPVEGEDRDRIYTEDAEFLPVTGVSWWDATAYARWAGKRLPTEAEWEKAARGTDLRRFPWGNEFLVDHANNTTQMLPVGSKPTGASPYGALDMAGNAAEWTATPYAPYPPVDAVLPGEFGGSAPATAAADAPDPLHGAAGDDSVSPSDGPAIEPDDPRLRFFQLDELQDVRPRVYRGGSFNSFARFLRCANRQSESPGSRWDNLGFRCVIDAGGGTKP